MSDFAEVLVSGGLQRGLGNIIGRPGTALSASQVQDAIFPLVNLGDGRPGQKWIAPANIEDQELVAEVDQLVGNFNSWFQGLPVGWTVNLTGNASIFEDVDPADVVSGSSAQVNNGTGTIEIIRDVNFRTGEELVLRATAKTSVNDSPYALEIQDLGTSLYLTPGGLWSVRKHNCITGVNTVLAAASIPFTVDDYETTGRLITSLRVRIHMGLAVANRTHHWDDVLLVPAADFVSVHSHNLEPRIRTVVAASDESLLGVPVDTAVRFNGSSQLTRAADFSGAVDNAKGTVSIWFRMAGGNGSRQIIIANGSSRFLVERRADNTLRVLGQDSGGTNRIEITTTATVLAGVTWHHLVSSWDTALAAGSQFLFLDGVQDDNPTVSAGDVDYTTGAWALGGDTGGTNDFNGDLGEVWFNPGTWWNLSVVDNLRLFRTASGKPAVMDAMGRGPLDAPPILFYRPANDAGKLLNHSGAGDFTAVVGTVLQTIEELGYSAPHAPSFWIRSEATLFRRYYRLHFRGQQSGGDENSIAVGEWVLCKPKTLLKNPDQADFERVELLTMNVLETAYNGEKWSIKKETQNRRGYRLHFEQINEAHALYSEEIWYRAEMGADSVLLVPSTLETPAIHGTVRQGQLSTSKQTHERQATDLDFFENPHGIVSE